MILSLFLFVRFDQFFGNFSNHHFLFFHVLLDLVHLLTKAANMLNNVLFHFLLGCLDLLVNFRSHCDNGWIEFRFGLFVDNRYLICDIGNKTFPVSIFIVLFFRRYNHKLNILTKIESLKQQPAFSIKLCSHFILVNEIFGIDFLIGLGNDSNQKVKQDNKDQKLVKNPDEPNDVDHDICRWMGGFPGNPLGVDRWTNVSDTILYGL